MQICVSVRRRIHFWLKAKDALKKDVARLTQTLQFCIYYERMLKKDMCNMKEAGKLKMPWLMSKKKKIAIIRQILGCF